MKIQDIVKNKLSLLPKKSGVYEMLDKNNKVIYVGKTINLYKRVSSYFNLSKKDMKTQILLEKIRDFNFIITKNELEALVLESNIIKDKKPKYNIILMDGKHYPYLKIKTKEHFPKLEIVRVIKKDKALYFGPYTSMTNIQEVIKIIEEIFTLRMCSDKEMKNRSRPCLNYQINRCCAPCMNYISKEEYKDIINEIILFLSGKNKTLISSIKNKMLNASKKLKFEIASKLRNQMQLIKKITEKQQMDSKNFFDKDVIGFFKNENIASVFIFFIRQGKIIDKKNYFLDFQKKIYLKGDILKAFLEQYYNKYFIPKEIILPFEIKDIELLKKFLFQRKRSKIIISIPKIGEKKHIINLANKNAKEICLQKEQLLSKEEKKNRKSLEDLKKYLGLSKTPFRIESFDISHNHGEDTVASMIVFTNGAPDYKSYRKFIIKDVIGINDFKSIEEVIYRRFKNYFKREKGFEKLPNLIIIDGGKGQLSSAIKILNKFRKLSIPTFALAKKNELLFGANNKNPIFIPKNLECYNLIQRIRDEAHRFAVSFYRKKANLEMTKSVLDEIKGIGEIKKTKLLKRFGSIENIKKNSIKEIMKVINNKKISERIKKVIGKNNE